MGDARGPLRRRQSGIGRAVPEASPIDPHFFTGDYPGGIIMNTALARRLALVTASSGWARTARRIRLGSFKRSQMADYLSAMAPVSTNALSWLGESGYALARYRAFLKHARKPSSHDQQLPRHGVWPTCGPNCAAYIAHSFPGTLGLFCRTRRLPPHMNSAKP